MKIGLLTNEYPPHIYGGAGVHLEYLSQSLSALPGHEVEVLCFGEQTRDGEHLHVQGIPPPASFPCPDPRTGKLLDPLFRNIQMAGLLPNVDIVHCHTWYTHLAGCLIRKLHDIPLVLTTHSLEPHRPWKREQLGNAYDVSSWIEATAYGQADGVIAVSESMRRDVMSLYGVPAEKVRVIPNGIDIAEFHRSPEPELMKRHGIDITKPIVLFVGRITRQKGVSLLLDAVPHLAKGCQLVLCAGAPDTEEIGKEVESKVHALRENPGAKVVWIPRMLSKHELIGFYSSADLFVCPSVYEPFGIINLEAMACQVPVVASSIGGIPEVVVDGETGLLFPFEAKGELDFEPKDPAAFSHGLAGLINRLLDDSELRKKMALAARAHVETKFAWSRIASATAAFYQELRQNHGR